MALIWLDRGRVDLDGRRRGAGASRGRGRRLYGLPLRSGGRAGVEWFWHFHSAFHSAWTGAGVAPPFFFILLFINIIKRKERKGVVTRNACGMLGMEVVAFCQHRVGV